jgi:hypothetical protein
VELKPSLDISVFSAIPHLPHAGPWVDNKAVVGSTSSVRKRLRVTAKLDLYRKKTDAFVE